jgi:GT2 family glycosyltransferase/tetratricopeptide (TPR) repeat protein/2-polyprenyl-3-methyl-5-hydroxy-6-metoxy-1,4-benzoquinol methylase
MTIRRVAVIYDDRARPETTGFYCRRALGTLVEVEHFLPTELSRIPRQGFDLYLNIDDGLDYRLPADLRPAAWWAIDTHLDFDRYLAKGPDFDLLFAAQRDGAERLRQAGVASARWLPLACDPDIHARQAVPKEYDVCFVGTLAFGLRADLVVGLLRRRFRNMFVGQRYFEDMARVYSASRLVFNRSIRNDVNMRVFEALACGSLLVTNDLGENGQAELFQDGVHLATYREPEELLDKVAFYLARETVRERIAAAGRKEVLARHTYLHRMASILQTAEQRPTSTAVRPPAEAPDPLYYEYDRPEVVALVPHSARTVLDIGCGAGRLGEVLKSRQPAEVVGVECVELAAQAARGRLDRVVVADAEQLDAAFAPGYFDAVVCADVLEHLRDPARLLRLARGWLKPGGRLVASIPNVRNHEVVQGLLDGHWTYQAAGLLDRTHLRFFTRREIEKLFQSTGFTIRELGTVPGQGYDTWVQAGRPGEVKVGRLHVGGMAPEEAEEFYVYQYLVSAEPAPAEDFGLTSIVVVTHNELDFTRQCVDSIRRCTEVPYELIFVDNGSTDGTPEYLRAVPNATLIANPDNRGFPAAANQGIRAARGQQVLLLNNDCVVPRGWLGRLLRALHSEAKVGLVSPCSNFVSGEQQVPAPYTDLQGLDDFAVRWAADHRGLLEDTDRLVGFCLLIRREVIDRVGLLDERFGLGCFEDDDYCLRTRRAGFRAVIAREAFVHHYGGRTFVGSGVDFAALMRDNQRLFQEKWAGEALDPVNPPEPAAARFAVRAAPGGGLILERASVEISLCMIVRDNARTIEACLTGIKPWVDEMVVVDTGSSDETPRLAERLGARVYHFPWPDSFAVARNESLRHALGRWVFWMDSDDLIDAENGRRLRELIRAPADPALLGYVMQVHCPGPGPDGHVDVTVVDHVKLFRNLPELRFSGRIHEQILPALRAAGGEVAFADVFVVHAGYDHSPEGQRRKVERDLRLLHLELAEQPEHPFTLFNLGMTYADQKDFGRAIAYLRRSIARSGAGESHLRKAYALLVYSLIEQRQHEAAAETLREGLRLFPRDLELRFREGILLQATGRLAQAAAAYERLFREPDERHFSSLDPGMAGFKARQNLAVVYADMGELPRAAEQWRRVVAEVPRYRPGWRGLAETLLQMKDYPAVLAVADQLLREPSLRSAGVILRSQVAAAQGDVAGARRDLEDAVREFPEDREPQEALCRLLFDHGAPAEAEQALQELIRRSPGDGAAHHNLGTLYMHLGRPSAAAEAYRRSLQQRPDAPLTALCLGYALRDVGDLPGAVTAWEETLRLAPGHAEATSALAQLTPRSPTAGAP